MESVDVVVGLQYGSEAKGVIAQHLASNYKHVACCNSSQAGHTIYVNGKKYVNRQLPSGWCNPEAKLYIGAGAMINPTVLAEEIEIIETDGFRIRDRLFIDENAGIVTPEHVEREKQIYGVEGQSTREGVGAAWQDRVVRKLPTAADWLRGEYDVVDVSRMLADVEEPILVEGCQGFGLSLFHGPYPHVTSRDTTPASLLAGVGLNPHRLQRVFGVMRRYPIRIHGNSGPMGEEIDWPTVTKRCGSPEPLCEMTTVTKKVRRVAEIDWEMLKRAIEICGVTDLCLTFLNYCNWIDYEKSEYQYLSDESKKFIWEVYQNLGKNIEIINTSPLPEHTFKLDGAHMRAIHYEMIRGNRCKGLW